MALIPTEFCSLNNCKKTQSAGGFVRREINSIETKYGIPRIMGEYNSRLEYTFLWIVDANDPHKIQDFCIETGIAFLNALRMVPLSTFDEGVVPKAIVEDNMAN